MKPIDKAGLVGGSAAAVLAVGSVVSYAATGGTFHEGFGGVLFAAISVVVLMGVALGRAANEESGWMDG